MQVLSDEELDEHERAQLQLENEALQKELDCLAEQAREAESKVRVASGAVYRGSIQILRGLRGSIQRQ